MSIVVKCACGAKARVGQEAAGRKVRCPKCEAVMEVPSLEKMKQASLKKERPPKKKQQAAVAPVLIPDDPAPPSAKKQTVKRVRPPEPEAVEDYGPVDDVIEDFDSIDDVSEDFDEYDDYGDSDFNDQIAAENGRHSVTMDACEISLEAIGPKRLQNACDELADYLAASPGTFKRSRITLAIQSKVKDKATANFKLRMSGTINGQSVRKSLEGIATDYGAGVAGASLAGGALAGAMTKATLIYRGGEHGGLQQEFANVRQELYGACDKAIGRKSSKATGRWVGIQVASGIAALLGFIGVFLLFKTHGNTVGWSAIAAAFPIVPLAVCVLSLGLITMPDGFFQRDAVGRKVLQMSGAKTPAMARVVAGISAVVMVGIVIAIVWVGMNSQ